MIRLVYRKALPFRFQSSRSYFDFREGKWHEESRHEPPKPPKDFHAAYISKPLYWNAKGRPEVFREKNQLSLTAAAISVICMVAGVCWLYYREFVKGHKSPFAKFTDWCLAIHPRKDAQTSEVTGMRLEMQRLGLMQFFRWVSPAGEMEFERKEVEILDYDINNPNKVPIRAETGRDIRAWDMTKLDEYLRKSDSKYVQVMETTTKTQ